VPPYELEFTVRELSLLAQKAPGAYQDLISQKQLDQQHRRRIAWAGFICQIVGHVCGLIALLVLAVVAWHALDLGDATQGAAIICTGAASIVAVFVTGRITGKSTQASDDSKEP
jgi:hypothetical protein